MNGVILNFFRLKFPILFILLNTAYADPGANLPSEGRFRIGNVRVHFILGNIVGQNSDAYVVANWASAISEGGAAGAIWAAGAKKGFEEAEKVYASQGGHVPKLSAFITESGGGNSKFLVHVASLKAEEMEYVLETVNDLDRFPVPFSENSATKGKLKDLLMELESKPALSPGPGITDELQTKRFWERQKIKNKIAGIVKSIGPDPHQELLQVVSRAVYNSLEQIDRHASKIRKVTMPVLGTGIMGDLSISESFKSTLAGLQSYVLKNPTSEITDLAIVVYGAPNAANKKFLEKEIVATVGDGRFFNFYFESTNPIKPDASEWKAARETFMATEGDKLRKKRSFVGVLENFFNYCRFNLKKAR